MTRLEELKADLAATWAAYAVAYHAWEDAHDAAKAPACAADLDALVASAEKDAWGADWDANAAWATYQEELKKAQEENSND